MQKWFKKTGLPALLVFCLFAGLTGNANVIVQAKTETSVQSLTVKIGTKKINKKTYTMKQGSSKKVRLLAVPKTSKVKAKYRSGKKSIVSVSKIGVLKAKKAGTAKITVTVSGKGNFHKKLWFKVKVVNGNNSDKKKKYRLHLWSAEKPLRLNFMTTGQRGHYWRKCR